MKKFTKLFLSCAAVTAVTAAVATSAMAADVTGDLAGTYADGKLSLTTELSGTATVLVLKPNTSTTSVSADDILYIDQVEDGNFGAMGLKGAPSDENEADLGTYTVMVGSYVDDEFVVKTGSFKLGSASVLIGDADQDGFVDGGDASVILKYNVGQYKFVDNGEEAADADQDGFVDGGDASAILKYNVDRVDSTNDKVGTYK